MSSEIEQEKLNNSDSQDGSDNDSDDDSETSSDVKINSLRR